MTESREKAVVDKGITTTKAAAKPRKFVAPAPAPAKQAEEAATEITAAGEAVVEQLMPSPAQLAETGENIEAATSPATQSDPIETPAVDLADPAPITKEPIDMATVASPTDATEKAQALFGDYSNRFKTAFEKSSKIGEDLVDFAKGNVEAVIASARVAAKASESLGQEAAEFGKKNLETTTAAFKSFASVKSPTELFQLQSEFVKTQFDSLVAEASRVSESLMKVAGEVSQPISTRYALAAEKIKANSAV
ncbi:MAG TPA: phasin family protein [Sphingomonas sp.]|nr:phasin family protein [Sphingomonas sp.]